ncbi:ABC transporter permease [Alkalicoccus chagannorensis]|uniref:ABC transporter permease n=1 Tax=Alkalicoccus chagannorensis TaxID=427072 RepID=UPI000426190B|nr:ABC transporter permease subunit [Alkalicoccus chagannorensis]
MSSSVKSWLLLLPLLVFMILFVGQGMFRAFQESLDVGGSSGIFANYEALAADGTFHAALGVSVYVAFVSTMLSLLLGLLVTRTLTSWMKSDTWKLGAWFPMLIPHFVGAYLILLFFAPTGWFASAAASAGLGFPVMVQDTAYIGVILTYVWKEIPFVVLMLLPVYQEMDGRMQEVSRSLGAGRWTGFRFTEWPWVRPVLLETGLILFVFVIGAFEVPALLGVTYPSMVPVLAFDWFYQSGWSTRPLAQAMMVLLMLGSILLALLLLTTAYRWRERGRSHA